MAKLGVTDLRDLAIPSGWDATYLETLHLQDGTTYATILMELAVSVAEFNDGLARHDWLSLLVYPTPRETVRYGEGTSVDWVDFTEYALPPTVRGQLTGHMLPIKERESALNWTWSYLRKADRELVDQDIIVLLEGALNTLEILALTRLFQLDDDVVGSSGYSPGFANDAASHANSHITFTPRDFQGASFASTHEHYLRVSTHGALALQMIQHLTEHGHSPPFELWVAKVDVADWASIDDDTNDVHSRPTQWGQIQYAQTETLAAPTVSSDDYICALTTPEGVAFVRPLTRIPTNYAAMFKPGGIHDARNPLWARHGKDFGYGIIPLNMMRTAKAQNIVMGYFEIGFGVGMDRTAAVLGYKADAGAYTAPTIS